MRKKLFIFVCALLALHLLLVSTNHTYLYRVIKLTIFKGKLGPSIDEYSEFENRKIAASSPQPIPKAKSYNNYAAPQHLDSTHASLGTVAYAVIQNDSIKHVYYGPGHNDSSISNSFSMAKSIVSLAVGALILDGKIKSVNQFVCEFLPRYCEGEASKLRIVDLLTMSAGINFDENYLNPLAYPAKANYGRDLRELADEYRVFTKPGVTFNYQSGVSVILGQLVEAVSGKKLAKFVHDRFWNPMGAQHTALWSLDHAEGDEKAFCCFNATALDFARFGLLVLHNGKWNGEQLVDSNYIGEATTAASWLIEKNGEPNIRYGYQWWVTDKYPDFGKVSYMRGILGQYVFVIPAKNTVVVRLGHERLGSSNGLYPDDVPLWLEGAKTWIE